MSKGHEVVLHSFSLRIIQSLLKSTHYDLINSLGLSVPLEVSWGGIPIRNSQVATIPPKGLAIKLKSIIRDECIRDPKLSDNVFPNKSLGIYIPDICQWLSFDPFGKVIRTN